MPPIAITIAIRSQRVACSRTNAKALRSVMTSPCSAWAVEFAAAYRAKLTRTCQGNRWTLQRSDRGSCRGNIMRRRRAIEVFSLSFLDCICCGFGAVILFYVIISARSGISSAERLDDLKSAAASLQKELDAGRENLLRLRNTVDTTNAENATAARQLFHLNADLEVTKRELSAYDATSLARRERIEQLKSDVKSMEDGKRRLEAGSLDKGPPGQDIRAFRG